MTAVIRSEFWTYLTVFLFFVYILIIDNRNFELTWIERSIACECLFPTILYICGWGFSAAVLQLNYNCFSFHFSCSAALQSADVSRDVRSFFRLASNSDKKKDGRGLWNDRIDPKKQKAIKLKGSIVIQCHSASKGGKRSTQFTPSPLCCLCYCYLGIVELHHLHGLSKDTFQNQQ